MRTVKIMLVRINPDEPTELPVDRKQMLIDLYPQGTEFDFKEFQPRNANEHLKNCENWRPAHVILFDQPLPVLAMAVGFHHNVFMSQGMMRLIRINPSMEPATAN